MDISGAFTILCVACLADGSVQEQELATLELWADRFGLRPEQAVETLRRVRLRPARRIVLPERFVDRNLLFHALLSIVVADQVVTDGEVCFLQSVGQHFGLSADLVEAALQGALGAEGQAEAEAVDDDLRSRELVVLDEFFQSNELSH